MANLGLYVKYCMHLYSIYVYRMYYVRGFICCFVYVLLIGSGLVQVWFRFGSGLVQDWSRFGADLVQVWFSRSDFVQ